MDSGISDCKEHGDPNKVKRTSDWHAQLIAAGANFDDQGLVTDFGDPDAEAQAMRDSAIVTPLTGSGLISVSGDDASSFLNAQLTSDVGTVSAGRAQYSGYCTPKGRLLATPLLFSDSNAHWLLLPGELAEPVTARLQKYVLRAKAKLEVASAAFAVFGVTGARSAMAVADGLSAQQQEFDVRHDEHTSLIALPGGRYLLICSVDHAAAGWQKLTAHARPAGSRWWELQTIRSGIATITAATQEMFTPQMVALDARGGVSFEKGCYPGQEIVARTRYLGDVKRRLYHGFSTQPLSPGLTITGGEDDKTLGTVTNAAQAAAQEWEFLAVLQRDAVEADLQLRVRDGDSIKIERAVV
jgi:folate-binding protein YgfZ